MKANIIEKQRGTFIVFKQGNDFHEELIKNIVYCQSMATKSIIFLKDSRKISCPHNLKFLESRLSDAHFFRLNRSLLVNMKHIKLIINDNKCQVIMTDQSIFNIPASKKELLFSAFK
jgi:DNA-binding LytR/AlgR family response regulator